MSAARRFDDDDEEDDDDVQPLQVVEGGHTPKKSPFNPRHLLLGTLLRWPLIVAGVCLGLAGMKLVAKKADSLGKKEAKAETILQFAAIGEDARFVDSKTTVATLKDTVKIRENLLEAKKRLGLKADVDTLGKAVDARIQKNTTLLVIEAKAPSSVEAADLANTLREVFLERHSDQLKRDLELKHSDLQRRLAVVRADLRDQDRRLSNFTSANKIVDIEKESRALLEEYNNYGVLLENSQAERKTVEEQAIKLDHAIEELKARVKRESSNMAQLENLADVNTRIERIRDTIREDKESRKNIALLELKKKERDRAKLLIDKGFISQAQYDTVNAEYETQRIVTEETEQTEKWRAERAKLQKQIVPGANSNAAPSAPILQTMLVRTFDIQLQKIAVQKKVLSLVEARQRVKQRLDLMPGLQQQYDALKRNIAAREEERKQIEEKISQRQREIASRIQDFTVVSPAVAAPEAGGNKMGKLLPPIVAGLGVLVGIAAAAGLTFLDKSLLVAGQAGALSLPVLGLLPRVRLPKESALPVLPRSPDTDAHLALTAARLQKAVPYQGAVVVIAGLGPKDGAELAAWSLAGALGRNGERVVLVDLTCSADDPRGQSLAPLLLGEVKSLKGIVRPTSLENVVMLRRYADDLPVEALSGKRFGKLCDVLRERFDRVLILTEPISTERQTALIAPHTGGLVLVTDARRQRAAIEKSIQSLRVVGAPLVGLLAQFVPPRQLKELERGL